MAEARRTVIAKLTPAEHRVIKARAKEQRRTMGQQLIHDAFKNSLAADTSAEPAAKGGRS